MQSGKKFFELLKALCVFLTVTHWRAGIGKMQAGWCLLLSARVWAIVYLQFSPSLFSPPGGGSKKLDGFPSSEYILSSDKMNVSFPSLCICVKWVPVPWWKLLVCVKNWAGHSRPQVVKATSPATPGSLGSWRRQDIYYHNYSSFFQMSLVTSRLWCPRICGGCFWQSYPCMWRALEAGPGGQVAKRCYLSNICRHLCCVGTNGCVWIIRSLHPSTTKAGIAPLKPT